MTETASQKTVGSYRAEVRFASAPDVVFEAFTTVRGIAGWWTEEVSGSADRGGELRLGFPNSDGPRVVLHVDTAEPARSIVWSVRAVPPLPAWEEWAGTRIRIELAPDGAGGTTMRFEHEGLTPQLHCYDTCSTGWDHGLAYVRDYVDTGTHRPAF